MHYFGIYNGINRFRNRSDCRLIGLNLLKAKALMVMEFSSLLKEIITLRHLDICSFLNICPSFRRAYLKSSAY